MPLCIRGRPLAPTAATSCCRSRFFMHLENYIDGKWCHTAGDRKFASVNPSTGEEIARFDRSEPADVDAAIEAAHRAGPDWRAMPAPLRANYLVRVARIAQDREDELSQRISEEHGKTIG